VRSNSFFTTQEAAVQLGISKRTLFRYEKKGIFPKAQRNKINGWRRYSADDIDYLKKIIREGI
jgi:DNA-binding transcriptional MerR regulator